MNFEWSMEEEIEALYGAPGDRRELVEQLGCESCMRGPASCEHESECLVDAARQSRCDEAPYEDEEPYPAPRPSLCGEGAMSIDDWVLYHAPEE